MGGAIAGGLCERGYEIIVVDPVTTKFEGTHPKMGTFLLEADAIVVAVKPWLAMEVLCELESIIAKKQIMICSVAAGITLEQMSSVMSQKPLFRVMPNTAVALGQGMTFISHHNATVLQVEQINQMFATLGSAMIIDEQLMGAAMAVASCGIAYALRYARASMEGAIELGLTASAAQSIISQTLKGAAALLDTGNHPEAEIDKVTTPGGITIKGLNAMEHEGFTRAVIQGLKASR